jgi:viroplasmin and RNaseH domain-containing protein
LRIIRTGAELQVKKYSHACHKSFATSDAAEAFMQARMQTNYLIPSTNTEATTPLGSNGTDEDELVARLDVVTLGRS